ncbi:MAG: phosphatase PAP2 family protein [Gammaproteobacteria bacterium]
MIHASRAMNAARTMHLLINLVVFSVCYPLANQLAERTGVTRHIVFAFDHAVPFLPWMALPYMSSGLLLTLGFVLARDKDSLRALSQRLLLCTVTATLVFALYPLQFSFARPEVGAEVPAALFATLGVVDKPFNQFPSLHVAYCVVLWPTLRLRLPRVLAPVLAALLALVSLSTLFTFQHHVIDVAGGLLLGLAALWRVPEGGVRQPVVFHYAIGAGVLLVLALCLGQWWLLYGVVSLLLVALAYARGDAGFLRKRAGRHPLASWLLYAPYLTGYWLTWQAVRWRERGRDPFVQVAPGLLVGRRLSDAEARQLPAGCAVIDLANELAETSALRKGIYHHVPLLDLAPPPAPALEEALALIHGYRRRGVPVYLHCAMGYSRSILICKLYRERYRDDAIDLPA